MSFSNGQTELRAYELRFHHVGSLPLPLYVYTSIDEWGIESNERGMCQCHGTMHVAAAAVRLPAGHAAAGHDLLPAAADGRRRAGGPTTLCTTTPFETDPCCMPVALPIRTRTRRPLSTPRPLLNPYVLPLAVVVVVKLNIRWVSASPCTAWCQ